jgi:uncharacterized protein YndB with AHSA1/START domain
MASIRKHIQIDAPPDRVWDALRDVGALHTRLVPGFVTDTRMEENARVVTFGNGMVAREEIVSVDPERRRVCWAILDAPFDHYNAAAWVEPDINGGTRFIWTADPAAQRARRPGRRNDERRSRRDEKTLEANS